MATLTSLYTIAKVALGLGFVIFLHELGHFLAAKWAGVKVERFAIGFDFGGLRLWSRRFGETVYVLGAIPLGGYVKMLGEGDAEEGGEKTTDPRAFCNKSVGARMVIMSAGVVMNLVLGILCFSVIYTQGTLEQPAKLGAVIAGSAAYEAGLRPGDEIVSIDDRAELNFRDLQMRVKLSGQGKVLRLGVKRPGVEAPLTIAVEPRVDVNSGTPAIGIIPDSDLELDPEEPFAPLAGYDAAQAETVRQALKAGPTTIERVVGAGRPGEPPTPVSTIEELDRILDRLRGEAVVVQIRRTTGERERGRGPALEGPGPASGETVDVTLPPNHFLDLGFRPEIGPIASLQPGSPAEKAGLRKGDRIVRVDGREDFDPLRLPTLARERAGQAMTLEVERGAAAGEAPKIARVEIVPDDTPAWTEAAAALSVLSREPLEVPGFGLAYEVRPVIAAVSPGSPAEAAGLKAGASIASISVPPAPKIRPSEAGDASAKAEPTVYSFEGTRPHSLSAVFAALQFGPIRPLTIKFVGGGDPITYLPKTDPTWGHPLRGLQYLLLSRRVPPQGLAGALGRGLEDAIDGALDIFAMFRGLIQSRVSTENLAGLPRIAEIAYESASAGWPALIQFLGMLSINLAVLNFLPIPPLDGGQMVFLIAEKVRGRPLPEKAVNVGMLTGLALVLGLMLFTIVQDIVLIARGR